MNQIDIAKQNERLQEQVDELSKKIKAMEQLAKVGVWTLELETMSIYWSDEVYKIYALPIGTPVKKVDGISFYAEHERPRISSFLQKCIEDGSAFDEVFRFYDNDGVSKWVRSVGSAVKNEAGKTISLTGAFQDVSCIKESAEEKHAILDSTGMGLWTYNPKSQELHWDKSMYELFEISSTSFNGHYDAWEKSLHPADKEQAVRELEMALSGKKKFDTIFRIETVNGNVKYIKGRATITRDSDGNPEVMRGVNWDVTADMMIQKDLEAQKKIANHKAKLASIGELAAGIAHEINNPLAIVSGYIEKIKNESMFNGSLGDSSNEDFSKIENATS
ncbi:PAS domain-containing protein, partial [Oligoflexaceae bacterium]|nr:PAS domain-containing protein [Oligoflexaceae bacterium]